MTPVAKITAPSAEWDQRQGVWKLNNATRVAVVEHFVQFFSRGFRVCLPHRDAWL